ncbi:glycopeptide antibiotics resistance protein [Natronobacillus azotifigens]|uniref:VanZ family protein n=1 Tax=Natronobacillus azotifigens TaxID=472978 RepID=A0A9J6R9I4_9BACI|nr:VanZ family protein [Natronobacillus azotifigens]MCZ0701929.1 VanZ family protein [Natronobacillus azotifigens]
MKVSWHREIVMSIFVAYIIGLLSQTILPMWQFGIDSLTGEIYFFVTFENSLASINLIPFNTLYEYFFSFNETVSSWESVSMLNIAANLLLFLPFGFLLPVLWEEMRSVKRLLIVGVVFVLAIEFIQYFIGRSADIDDVILNSISIVFGYLIFKCYHVLTNKDHNN